MKKSAILFMVAAIATLSFGQNTNEVVKSGGEGQKNQERSKWTPEQREAKEQRKIQFMNRVLTEIGVSEEDKLKISELQAEYRRKMKENAELIHAAREKLSQLQGTIATPVEIDAAIDEISAAQGAQLKILVHNQMEMEKILGKEKYANFMEKARKQFSKHGGRGGPGHPPRPSLPPTPNQGSGANVPPPPPDGQPQATPPCVPGL